MSAFRKILSKAPGKTRTSFLESMVFANKKLVNIKTKGLGEVLKGGDLLAMMQSSGCTTTGYACDAFVAGQCFKSKDMACDAASCKGNKGFPVVTLGSLLQGVGSKPRQTFLNSLDFANGKLTKANTKVLQGHISPEDFQQLPQAKRK
jgi:hypothetical protein